MTNISDVEVTVAQEIANTSISKPHVVLLGAGASKAALPNGDKNGMVVPLLREVASALNLSMLFPDCLQSLATTDFEAAYSRLVEGNGSETGEIERRVRAYFSRLELPDQPTVYDVLLLSLRGKDAIFTFNWDPLLVQSLIRLARLRMMPSRPRLFFLHGNVMVGFCKKDQTSGLIGRACPRCGEHFEPSRLLFPVERKNYHDGSLIEREWGAVRDYLKRCYWLTIFGYSAPKTDLEAVELLKQGWGEIEKRDMEQVDIIDRPGADHDALRQTWDPFIHTHHYEIHDSFYDSWIGNHPRRSGEAYWNQYLDAKFIDSNPVPQGCGDLQTLAEWFEPLFRAERQ